MNLHARLSLLIPRNSSKRKVEKLYYEWAAIPRNRNEEGGSHVSDSD